MDCILTEKNKLADNIYDFKIKSSVLAENAKAGQFLHILCGGNAYLRRPISICEVIDGEYVRFIFQVKGEGTTALANANVGDTIDVLGPLGNGFSFDECENVIVIGGGIGFFPLLEVTKRLGKKAIVLLGFRSAENVILEDEFAKYTDRIFVATEDGSCGYKGYITDLLRNILETNKVDRIYACGPMPMMKAVSSVAADKQIDTQVSLEERMGCGIGACVTCTCNINGGRKRVSKDGPVFSASEVEWDA